MYIIHSQLGENVLNYTVVEVDSAEAKKHIGRFRVDVWRTDGQLLEAAFPNDIWLDEHDEHARHWVALIDTQIVGSARLCFHDHADDLPEAAVFRHANLDLTGPLASLNRLVVHRDFRGLGIANALDQARMAAALASKASYLIGQAVPERVAAAKRHGFVEIGKCPPTIPIRDQREFTIMIKDLRPTRNASSKKG